MATNTNSELAASDAYWLAKGSEMITATVSKRELAAEKLTSAIVWFWTVYSAAAIFSGVQARDHAVVFRILLAAPAVALILAYLAALSVLVPIALEFDPRVPRDIQDAYQTAGLTKQRRLRIAFALLTLSSVLVASAITATFGLSSR
jgi:hypothetical protein